jgi:hypothetical protein
MEMNEKNFNIPVTYNGKIVGYTNGEEPISIRFIDEESLNLVLKKLESPIYISSRRFGEINDDGTVKINEIIENSIIAKENE